MARKRTSSKRPARKATAGKAAAAKAGAGESKPAAARRAGRPSALLDTRIVHCGDCLDQLGKLPDGYVDLIYIDPPFNSNRNYEVFWGETKEKRAFEDRHASTQAYIEYMRPRCVELARVEADNSGTLKLAMTGALDDSTGTNRWKATAASAILSFDSAIGSIGGGSLQGEFVVSGASTAEIEVNEALTNLHRLRMENGLLDVNANLTMGSGTLFMDLTDDATPGSPTIDVAPGATFTHN